MNPTIKNIIAVFGGIVVAMVVNMAFITIGPMIIPPPEGADMTTAEGIQEAFHLLKAKHFIMPFVAHAMGSLAGALVAATTASSHKMTFAIVIGAFHLIGGVMAAVIIPAPTWFLILDLAVAYIPMALIGGKIALKLAKK